MCKFYNNSIELSRLQEEQINIGRKIEKEQHRKETLDNDIGVSPICGEPVCN